MEEIWLPVPDTDGKYEVSNMGKVRSRGTRNWIDLPEGEWRLCTLTQRRDGPCAGYVKVGINGKSWWVHRLVAVVHLPPPPSPDYVVDHKDRMRWHNSADNLHWVTRTENNRKTIAQVQGNTQKLTPEEAGNVKFLLSQGWGGNDIKLIYSKASTDMISRIKLGKSWHWLEDNPK